MDTNIVNNLAVSHIELNDRKKINLTGIKKLVSFDPEEFLMDTNLGPVVLKCSNLEIVKLDTLEGNLNIKGKIDSLVYLNGKEKQKDSSLIAMLFK